MDLHSLRPPARRRRGREGGQTVLEAGDAGGGARAPSEVGDVKRGGFSRPPPPWMAPAALHDATMGWVLVSSGCCTILSPPSSFHLISLLVLSVWFCYHAAPDYRVDARDLRAARM